MFNLYDTVYLDKNMVDHLDVKHDKGSLSCIVECLKDDRYLLEVFDPWGKIIASKNQIRKNNSTK